MGKSNPTPPDPVATAQAQTTANEQAAVYNDNLTHVNQYTPYGSETYQQTGTNSDGSPQYSSTINLTPDSAKEVQQQQANSLAVNNTAGSMLNTINNTYGTPLNSAGDNNLTTNASSMPIQSSINYGNLPGVALTANDFSSAAQQAQDAVMSRTQPEIDHEQDALNAQLANQGITPGSDAYTYAQKIQGQNANDATQQAVLAGNTQANALATQSLANRSEVANEDTTNANYYNTAQNTGYNQNLSNANLNNSALAQQLQQQITERELPLNEYSALNSGSQVQTPTFQNSSAQNVAAGDVEGLTENAYNQQVGTFNQNMAGLYSLGGSAVKAAGTASDRRLKKDIKRIGKTPGGFNVYEFRYINGDGKKQTGVMAQEIERHIPDAVFTRPDGFKMVRYSMVR